ncbi:MAG: acyl-CoA thioesterase [Prevotella sp.]|nr:acyl-CoA thioesterase [Bacteroides sp.]MCM1365721.1 acyl-CoA thioesterase [Prevotella sp.]MCM1436391.1 acyl-CoA thioesterase [Prevotella sp.]
MNPNNLPNPSDFRHHTDLQIRFSDVDILGHVNNTVYLAFYDTGKAHYFRSVRKDNYKWDDVDTVIVNVNCAFISSIVFGDDIEVLTRCEEIHDKSFKLLQLIREKKTGQIKSMCETVMVSFDKATKQACHVSDKWREALCNYEQRDLCKNEQ